MGEGKALCEVEDFEVGGGGLCAHGGSKSF